MTSTNHPPSPPPPLREWILVVDDEEPICRVIKESLASDRLEVVTASDASMALQIFDRFRPLPLLVITDVLMPGMDGLTLARKFRAHLPANRIVVISGHLSPDSWWPADLREINFLTKPFRLADLHRLVDAARADTRGRD